MRLAIALRLFCIKPSTLPVPNPFFNRILLSLFSSLTPVFNGLIDLEICTEHGSITAMICVNFHNDHKTWIFSVEISFFFWGPDEISNPRQRSLITTLYSTAAGLGSIPFFQFNFNSINSNSNSNPVLAISFNCNSNSGDSNSNSNSGDLKSRQAQFEKWPVDVFLEIDYNYTKYMCIKLLILIPSVSYPLVNGYNYMASWLILYQ